MAGVTSLSSTNFNGDYTGVDAGATLVASWSNGRPLAAINAAGNVAAITLFPNVVTYGGASGDYQLLFRNALAETANVPSPVPEPASMITLAAGAIGMLGFRMRKRKAVAGLVA